MSDELLITEDWLREVGFKWHQFDRQPDKHWLLWCGDAAGTGFMTSFEDIGIEVAPMAYRNRAGEIANPERAEYWFVWIRSDVAGRYSRFLHVRHMRTRSDLIKLVEAVTGQDWNPENHMYGSVRTPEQAARIRQEHERLDHRIRAERAHNDVEKDDTRGRALPEHMVAHAKEADRG
ncbi:hypothetical protein [Chelativorans sp. AA-79]|uniref:hypothetical protein n=1 Tax=Chelativorans sp. AA-79 TaxID=3028735 RepID=UPI0023F7E5E8|nr:hypothetical protein [Chelativorans sp. AA-79]WEX10340.1 hypothetical protein PVE73_05100 [Chelativorans sp. AA-79]